MTLYKTHIDWHQLDKYTSVIGYIDNGGKGVPMVKKLWVTKVIDNITTHSIKKEYII